jgi:hypothetical protein
VEELGLAADVAPRTGDQVRPDVLPAAEGRGPRQPIRYGRFQKEFLEEALADNIDAAILATAAGNGKSTGGGALATWGVFDDDETGMPQVPVIATTVGQAIRSIYGVAVAMIEAEPELRRAGA